MMRNYPRNPEASRRCISLQIQVENSVRIDVDCVDVGVVMSEPQKKIGILEPYE